MRFFLYTYAIAKNYEISRKAGVFGTKKDGTGLPTKVKQLRRGDLILIRDGTKDLLHFFGCCMVCGDVFDHDKWSPFRDLLWDDENNSRKVIYSLRVAVDFDETPRLSFDQVTWGSLDRLGFLNSRHESLRGQPVWAKKFAGNFVETQKELAVFSQLVGYSQA